MKLTRSSISVCVLMLVSICCTSALAVPAGAIAGRPVIEKVDPPNWWVGLPTPMLLVHGKNLKNANLSAAGAGVHISKLQTSANGHWAFIWLATENAAPTTVKIIATNGAGSASFNFPLLKRKSATGLYQGFSSKDVMYLIMPDRFADGEMANDHPADAPGTYDRSKPRAYHGGDLRGIEDHLNYIQQLGVTTIWTTPVYDNEHQDASSYHGYGATDMYAVNEHIGTLAEYKELARAVHQHGMKLVLDTVPNHVGPHHPWVLDPPTPDWFHGTLQHHRESKSPFDAITDPHAAFREYRDTVQGWFANTLPDLNQENPLVSQYLIQNAIWWVEIAGLDGLRLDTFPYVGRPFWHDFHAELHQIYPHLTTVGEVFNPDPTITSYFAGGVKHAGTDGDVDTGLYTPFDFPDYFAIRAVLAHDEPMSKLVGTLRQDWLYPHPERLVTFLGNHDTKRFLSEPGATPAKLKLAFGLLATLRGMPQIYSGDEIAMAGGDDPDNRRDFPGGFPGDKQDAFSAQRRTPEQADVHDWVAALFQFRAKHPALQMGTQQNVFIDKQTFAFVREQGHGEKLLIIVNNSGEQKSEVMDLHDTVLGDSASFLGVFNLKGTYSAVDGKLIVPVKPEGMVILQVR